MTKKMTGHFEKPKRLSVWYKGNIWEIHAHTPNSFVLSQTKFPEDEIYIFNIKGAVRAKFKDLKIATNSEIYINRFDNK